MTNQIPSRALPIKNAPIVITMQQPPLHHHGTDSNDKKTIEWDNWSNTDEHELIQRESNIQSGRCYDMGFKEGALRSETSITQSGFDDGYKKGFLSGFLSFVNNNDNNESMKMMDTPPSHESLDQKEQGQVNDDDDIY